METQTYRNTTLIISRPSEVSVHVIKNGTEISVGLHKIKSLTKEITAQDGNHQYFLISNLTIAIGDGDIFDDESTKKLFQVPTAAINCQNHIDISTIKIKKFFEKCLLKLSVETPNDDPQNYSHWRTHRGWFSIFKFATSKDGRQNWRESAKNDL
jgi:hypothetical protein